MFTSKDTALFNILETCFERLTFPAFLMLSIAEKVVGLAQPSSTALLNDFVSLKPYADRSKSPAHFSCS